MLVAVGVGVGGRLVAVRVGVGGTRVAVRVGVGGRLVLVGVGVGGRLVLVRVGVGGRLVLVGVGVGGRLVLVGVGLAGILVQRMGEGSFFILVGMGVEAMFIKAAGLERTLAWFGLRGMLVLTRTAPDFSEFAAAYTGCFCTRELVNIIAIITPTIKDNLMIELIIGNVLFLRVCILFSHLFYW